MTLKAECLHEWSAWGWRGVSTGFETRRCRCGEREIRAAEGHSIEFWQEEAVRLYRELQAWEKHGQEETFAREKAEARADREYDRMRAVLTRAKRVERALSDAALALRDAGALGAAEKAEAEL